MSERMDPVTARMPTDLLDALRQRADQAGETVSDVLRRAALKELGICPTCGTKIGPDRARADVQELIERGDLRD